eukprot:TRINITY_DN36390_c0_g1_i1.p2 TRINITY_DN36390_c0_g1~~TRINITY_DN36390_c0_g1_i1.p2  ORF type:complete len:102 (+),score=4.12 TRINITY_DN36390_c0_g1_i1:204-509(+)
MSCSEVHVSNHVAIAPTVDIKTKVAVLVETSPGAYIDNTVRMTICAQCATKHPEIEGKSVDVVSQTQTVKLVLRIIHRIPPLHFIPARRSAPTALHLGLSL